MRSARVAEWILSLFLEPNRAAACTGDLMEEAAEHGSVWFWSSVARLALMRMWQDISDSPFFMAGVLIRACVLNLALYVGLVLGSRILITLIALIVKSFRAELVWNVSGLMGFWIAALFAVSFLTGRWIAQRAPNREIAACILMCAVLPLVSTFVGFALVHASGASLQHYADRASATAFGEALIWLAVSVGIIAGGLQIRSRSLRSITQ